MLYRWEKKTLTRTNLFHRCLILILLISLFLLFLALVSLRHPVFCGGGFPFVLEAAISASCIFFSWAAFFPQGCSTLLPVSSRMGAPGGSPLIWGDSQNGARRPKEASWARWGPWISFRPPVWAGVGFLLWAFAMSSLPLFFSRHSSCLDLRDFSENPAELAEASIGTSMLAPASLHKEGVWGRLPLSCLGSPCPRLVYFPPWGRAAQGLSALSWSLLSWTSNAFLFTIFLVECLSLKTQISKKLFIF